MTPATVRVHIKHVYAKTDLHSRQEIIDRMESA
ncbi:LuxR C-terminal-related transcriptional regulator [Slackia piriformis]